MNKGSKKGLYSKSKKDMLAEIENYPDVLLTDEVMRVLDIDTNKVYKLLKFGEIECPKLHKDYIISRISVRHYIMGLSNENFIDTKEVI